MSAGAATLSVLVAWTRTGLGDGSSDHVAIPRIMKKFHAYGSLRSFQAAVKRTFVWIVIEAAALSDCF